MRSIRITIFISLFLFLCNTKSVIKPVSFQSGRSQDAIQSVIINKTQKLAKIYQSALYGNPDISGRLNLRFVIQPDGNIKDISIKVCTIADTQFVNRIIKDISSCHFPAINDTTNIEVIYPFVFQGQH